MDYQNANAIISLSNASILNGIIQEWLETKIPGMDGVTVVDYGLQPHNGFTDLNIYVSGDVKAIAVLKEQLAEGGVTGVSFHQIGRNEGSE